MSEIYARLAECCPDNCDCKTVFGLADRIYNASLVEMESARALADNASSLEEILNQIIDAALKFFDEFDIPKIGPALEKVIKSLVRGPLEAALRSAAEWILDLFHPEPPNPGPAPPEPEPNGPVINV